MRRLFTLICFFVLSGCVLGPNYHRPYIDIPEAYRYEIDTSEAALNIAWWEQFQDPILTQLIEEGLANNKDIKIAAANIENAAGIFLQVRAPFFPQIGYAGNYTRLRQSQLTAVPVPITVPNPQTNFQILSTLNWQIDFWGRIRRQIESARANYFSTIEARQNVILSLVASIANAYLQLRGFDEQLNIAKDTLKSYEDALKYFELQFNHGQVSQMTVAQAKTQYETAASTIPEIKTQIAQTEDGLSVLLGRNPGPILRGKSIYDLQLPRVPGDIPSDLLERRPDILQAEQNLTAANAQIGAAMALYFPSLTLTGNYGSASEELKNLFKGPAKTWDFSTSIVGPIFTWGAIYGQVERAEAETLAALLSYEETILKAFADVENALVSHSMLIEQFAAEGRLVEASKEYVHLAKLQYNGGYSPYFVVLQAQQQLFPSELTWTQTRVALFTSLVNIYQALGGGWVDIAEQMTQP
jgi:outer membrane protein, multidrug efflux system